MSPDAKEWCSERLGELSDKIGSGATPRGGATSYKTHGVPLIRSMNIHFDGFRNRGLVFLDDDQAEKLAGSTVASGDILLNITGASIGRVTYAPDSMDGARVNQHVCIIRPSCGIESRFVSYFIASPTVQRHIDSEESGATRQALTKSKIQDFDVPVPPLNEQRRIVAKIEALQAHSDAAKRALDAIPPLLEAFRQSVLAAAFRGDLTKTWREQNPDVEPASALLERIRAERKARFIAAAGDKAEAKARAKALDAGKPWTEADAAKAVGKARAKAEAKYVEPEPVDEEGLPELPEGWCWTNFGTAFKVGVGATPSRKETNYWNGDIPWVSSGEVAFCRISGTREAITGLGLSKTSTEIHPPGTVLLGMIGEGKTRGQAAILDIPACNNQNCAAIRVGESGIPPEFIYRFLELNYQQTRRSGSGNNQPALNKSRVQAMAFPLPPKAESIKIVEFIEARLSYYNELRAILANAQSGFEVLNQSILAKAFRGELVPQDPNDEPASVLLERIRAERAAAEPAKKTRRRKKKTAKAKAEQPKPAAKPKPTPPEPAPPGLNAPTRKASQLSILEPPPEPSKPGPALVDEAGEVMLHLRAHLRGRGAVPREEVIRALAGELGYKRVGHVIRRRLDGHLLAAVRRGVLERGGGEEVRLATRRLEDYERDELVTALRSVSRRGGVYEREALSRAVLAHLGFRRLTKGAKEALRSAFNAAVRRKVFERVDASRVRRLD